VRKDPRARYQNARDVANQLRWIHEEVAADPSFPRERVSGTPAVFVPGLIGLVMGGVAVGSRFGAADEASRRYEPVSLANPVQLTKAIGSEHSPTIAMYTDRDGGGYDVMSALGGSLRRFTAAKPIAQDYGAPNP
jgi:hypothetical protein